MPTPTPSYSYLSVNAYDPLATLEVADNTGRVIMQHIGNLQSLELLPGFYLIRLRIPEGRIVEKILDLAPGEKKDISVTAPEPSEMGIPQEIIRRTEFETNSNNVLEVSEFVGPMVNAQPSTLLTLAARINTYRREFSGGGRLRKLGLSSFRNVVDSDLNSGLQVIFGTEHFESKYISNVKLSVLRQGLTVNDVISQTEQLDSLRQSSEVGGIAEYALPLDSTRSGPQWLIINLSGQEPVVFNLIALPGMLTMLVFYREDDGHVNVFQYLQSLHKSDYHDERVDLENLRRLEMIERFFSSGRLDYANNYLKLPFMYYNPIYLLLDAYILMRIGKVREISYHSLLWSMPVEYPFLSDSHVVIGQNLLSTGQHTDAKNAFKKSLDTGLPIFADGLRYLVEAVRRYDITHERRNILEESFKRRIRGMLWSVWNPIRYPYEDSTNEKNNDQDWIRLNDRKPFGKIEPDGEDYINTNGVIVPTQK
jgi:hypothetical protein